MIETLIKHVIIETAIDAFFQNVQKNIISFKAQQVILSNIRKVRDTKNGTITYSTYYEGKLIKSTVTLEVISDLKAMHGIDIDETMMDALKYEAMVSVFGYENIKM